MTILAGKRLHVQLLSRSLTLAALAALAMGIASLPAVARAQGLTPEPALALEMTDRPAVTWMPKPFPVPNSEAKAEGEMKEYAESLPSSEVKFDMAPIKGGKFKIGSPVGEKGHKDDEGPQVEVVIEPFWMGKFEVTWEEYDSWASELDKQRRSVGQVAPTEWDKLADAVAYPTKPYSDMTFGMGKDRRPAVCMTQYAAQTYCKWLCGKTGRYYRLATEAEWEYACRAGTTTAYSFGDDPSQLKDYAVFADNSGEKYAKVGTKKPNPWGLYDMHGNVAEWVLDQYVADAYKKADGASLVCPWCKPTKEYPCVVRGGSWDDDKPEALRCAARLASNKDWKQQDPQLPQSIWYMTNASHVGFRVVRPLRMPTEAESRAYEPDPQIRLDYKKAQGGKS